MNFKAGDLVRHKVSKKQGIFLRVVGENTKGIVKTDCIVSEDFGSEVSVDPCCLELTLTPEQENCKHDFQEYGICKLRVCGRCGKIQDVVKIGNALPDVV